MSLSESALIVFCMRVFVSSELLLLLFKVLYDAAWLLKFEVTLPRRNALRINSLTFTFSA